MPNYHHTITAKRASGKLAAGMFVEIVLRNTSRKPNQKEVVDAFNSKYGAGTVVGSISLSTFDFS